MLGIDIQQPMPDLTDCTAVPDTRERFRFLTDGALRRSGRGTDQRQALTAWEVQIVPYK